MHLKRLEMIGFKSFADRTELGFVPGITAVVGPNGSGKSNVTDGIRWVLGEQSAKSLRGSKMEDVIFNGSESRKPVGYCEVSLTLDNTDQHLKLDYSEVRITRRVYRSGEGQYFINNQPCRLKDITELFMDTGIGKEAYSMIGQGRIDDILSGKSEDRRAIFEEVAGIVKYKARKQEAERKLEATEQNLDRVKDLILELEDRFEPLAKQAEQAREYKKLKEQLKESEIGLYVHKIDTLHQSWQKAKEAVASLSEEQVAAVTDVRSLEASLEKFRLEINQHEEAIEKLQAVLLEKSEELEKAEGQREVLLERMRNHQASLIQSKERISQLEQEQQRLAKELQECRTELAAKEQELAQAKEKLRQTEAELEALGDTGGVQLQELKAQLGKLENELAALRSEKRHHEEQWAERRKQLESLQINEKLLKEKEEEIHQKINQNEQELKAIEEKLQLLAEKYQEYTRKQRELEQQVQEASRFLRQAEQKVDTLRSRRDIVQEMEAEFAGFFQGVKEILGAKEQGVAELRGVHGAVAQLIHVPKDYEAAMETALGSSLQHVVVEDEEAGRRGIHFLKQKKAGRATFLPLSVIRERLLPERERGLVAADPGFVGVASDLVESEPLYQKVVRHLLGQVIVCRTLNDANRLASQLGYRYRIVTLDGDVVNPGGSMTGGSRRKSQVSLLGRTRQLKELEEQLQQAEVEQQQAFNVLEARRREQQQLIRQLEMIREEGEASRLHQQELHGNRRELAAEQRAVVERLAAIESERQQLDEVSHRLQESLRKCVAQQQELEAKQQEMLKQLQLQEADVAEKVAYREKISQVLTEWKVAVARITQEQESLATSQERMEADLKRVGLQLAEVRQQATELATQLAASQQEEKEVAHRVFVLKEEREKIQEDVAAARRERERMHSEREMREKELRIASQNMREKEEELRKQEIRVNRLDVELSHLLGKLAEEYELGYELAKERYEVPSDVREAEREVAALKRRIAQLGEVNLGAIEEHARLEERLSFLNGQQEDLIEAKKTLYEVIANIEEEMARRFAEGFEAIRHEFSDVFTEMFGGGEADLRLTDPDNLLETGIEIIAQPPGKKPQHLNLLSGGERALTAIALLFAVLRIKPVPFCVLDEVDAALDEANLTRLTRFLREFSKKTQFIIITHRKQTMEGADVMYGITMEESGVSKLVSVKLEDYEQKTASVAAGE